MDILDSFEPRRSQSEIAPQALAYKAVVSTAPADVDDTLSVTVDALDEGQHEYVAKWDARGALLPEVGDEALVQFDEEGDAWVVTWWSAAGNEQPSGGAHTHPISDITGLQAALDGKAALAHTHAIADTTGLQAALDAKAPLASPALTGVPTAPTAAGGTNTTQLATTAFVQAALGSYLTSATAAATYLTIATAAATYAPISSPTFTGTPLSTTPSTADNSTKIATTAYVQANLGSYLTTASAAATYLTIATAASTYAPLASPALTGNPTAPTQTAGNNSTRLATTAFVQTALGSYLTTAAAASTYAPLASPALTGNPTAPTQAAGDNSTKLATTAFVAAAITKAKATLKCTTSQVLVSATATKVDWDTTVDNSGMTVDLTNNRVTVPRTGDYALDVLIVHGTTSPSREQHIRVNGSTTMHRYHAADDGGTNYFHNTYILSLTAGDYIEVWETHTTSGLTLHGVGDGSFLTLREL